MAFALALALVACAGRPPRDQGDWLIVDEAALAQGERESIQESLVWLGHYDAPVDGEFAERTRAAIRAFQQSLGAEPAGRLTREQRDELLIRGQRAKLRYAPVDYLDLAGDYAIVYPGAIVAPVESGADGTRRFVSSDGTVALEVVAFEGVDAERLRRLYDDERRGDAVRTVRYRVFGDTGFVVSGLYGGKAFYTKAIAYDSRIVLFRYSYPIERRDELERLSTVLANALRPGTASAKGDRYGSAAPPMESVEKDTGSVAPRRTWPYTAQELFDNVNAAVYKLVDASGPQARALGAAVAIDSYRLLTTCHVFSRADAVYLDRDGERSAAFSLKKYADRDLCVLFSIGGGLDHIEGVRSRESIRVGEQVYSISAPYGFDRTLSDGLVSRVTVEKEESYIQVSAPTFKGSSGGGLFDAWGCLIGVTTFRIDDEDALTFAVPVEDVFSAEERGRLANRHCR